MIAYKEWAAITSGPNEIESGTVAGSVCGYGGYVLEGTPREYGVIQSFQFSNSHGGYLISRDDLDLVGLPDERMLYLDSMEWEVRSRSYGFHHYRVVTKRPDDYEPHGGMPELEKVGGIRAEPDAIWKKMMADNSLMCLLHPTQIPEFEGMRRGVRYMSNERDGYGAIPSGMSDSSRSIVI